MGFRSINENLRKLTKKKDFSFYKINIKTSYFSLTARNNKKYIPSSNNVPQYVFYSHAYSHAPLGIKFDRIELKGGLKKQEK